MGKFSQHEIGLIFFTKCFDVVGWAAGRASGL